MARGTQLLALRNMVKAEIGFSSSVGTQLDSEINTLLSTEQKRLATSWNWPFLQTRFDVPLVAGQRYVNVPNGNFERPPLVEIYWSALWDDVDYGIGSEQYNYINSDLGNGQDPVLNWNFAGQVNVPSPQLYSITVANSAVAGNLGAGVYLYAFTYVTVFGETGLSVSSSPVTAPGGKQMNLSNVFNAQSVTLENGLITYPEVNSKNIYRTKAGGSTFYLVGSIADNVTTTYIDNLADASLSVVAPTSNNAEATVMEVWPVPVSNQQTIRFTMQRNLLPLVADTDTADLDDVLLTKFVSAKILIRRKQEDGQLLLQQAEHQLTRVRANYPRKTQSLVLGGSRDKAYNKIVPMTVIAVHG